MTGNENTVSKATRTRVLLPKLYEPSDGGRMPVIFICLSLWMRRQLCILEDSLQVVAPFRHQFFFLSGTKTSAEVPIKPLLFNVFLPVVKVYFCAPLDPYQLYHHGNVCLYYGLMGIQNALRSAFWTDFLSFFCTYS